VTNIVSDSDSGLLHKGCSHEPLLCGVVVVAVDAVAGARVSVGVAAVPDVIWVGATVPGATDTDPQAITASMVTRQKAVRNW